MHAGHHHLLARAEAAGDDGLVAIGAPHLHRHRLDGHRGPVHHPHRRLAALLQHRGQRQLDDARALRQVQHHGGRLPELRVQRAGVGLDQKGARDRIGCCRHLAQRQWEGFVAAPQPHPQRARLARRRFDASDLVLGHRKHNVTRAIQRDANHRCPSGQHLARLRVYAGDHARRVRHQLGIARLVALHIGLGPCLLKLGLGRLEGGITPLQLGHADESLALQVNETLVVLARLVAVGARGGHGRAGSRLGQPQVLPVETRQQLAGLDRIAQVDRTAEQLARNAEGQARFDARLHLGRILMT
mmetsp:Transcript_5978/g.23795  ORF Transcript_5978/g.23795 Transcript_5978/m.23795 type:complete len:301 (+) Transcript_5978:7390-8292(+)